MHVLQLVEATIAGVRRHVQTLAVGLSARGLTVTVACPQRRQQSFGEDEFVNELRRSGIRVVALPLQREVSIRQDTAALKATLDFLRAERFDLVHTHSSKAGFVGRIAARLAGIPAVHTPNSLHFLGQRNSIKRQFYLRVEQVLGRLNARLIAVSPSEQALMRRHHLAPVARIVLIPNGVDLHNLAPTPLDRAELGVPAGAWLIGTLARLEQQKNPALFLHAAALVARALPDTHFLWCGGGSLQGEATRLAKELGIASRVHFSGYRADALAVLAALDIFWLTSDFEGLPHALLEALALARPVVATDVVGNRDLVTDTVHGRLVARDDAAALARTTLDLLARPSYAAALAARGRQHVIASYATEQMVTRTTRLYQAVVQSPFSLQELTNREVPLNRQPRYVGDAEHPPDDGVDADSGYLSTPNL